MVQFQNGSLKFILLLFFFFLFLFSATKTHILCVFVHACDPSSDNEND